MKKILLASIGVVGLGVTLASATDLPRRQVMPAKAPIYMAPAPYNWTGFYYGVAVGGGWGRSDFSAPVVTGSFDLSGVTASGVLGFNYQVNQLVFGIEGDMGVSNIRGSTPCGGLTCTTRNDWLATVRGRLGYAIDRFMPYVTGGAAFGNIRQTVLSGFIDSNAKKTGWTVGGGIEAAIAGPWTAKVEYLYVDLGRGTAGGATASFDANIVRAGLNYRF